MPGKIDGGVIHESPFSTGGRHSESACYFFYGTGQGSAVQMSAAYSLIARSLENLPEQATFRTALRDQASGVGIQLADALLAFAYTKSDRPDACRNRRG